MELIANKLKDADAEIAAYRASLKDPKIMAQKLKENPFLKVKKKPSDTYFPVSLADIENKRFSWLRLRHCGGLW